MRGRDQAICEQCPHFYRDLDETPCCRYEDLRNLKESIQREVDADIFTAIGAALGLETREPTPEQKAEAERLRRGDYEQWIFPPDCPYAAEQTVSRC